MTQPQEAARAPDGGTAQEARLRQAGRGLLLELYAALRSLKLYPVENATVQKAGESALAERDYRRKGLGLSLIAIFIMMIGLAMYIRQIERKA